MKYNALIVEEIYNNDQKQVINYSVLNIKKLFEFNKLSVLLSFCLVYVEKIIVITL